MIRNNVQAAMTADKISVSLDRRRLIEPAKAGTRLISFQSQHLYIVNNIKKAHYGVKIAS